MKTTHKLICFLGMLGCVPHPQEIPENITLAARYTVHDEVQSPHLRNCPEEVLPFSEMTKYACSFRLGNLEFDLIGKLILDEKGDLKEYWNYKSEGPLIYSKESLKADPQFYESIKIEEAQDLQIIAKSQIQNGLDTLYVEKVFKKEKLILMKQNAILKKKGRRLIFEYYY